MKKQKIFIALVLFGISVVGTTCRPEPLPINLPPEEGTLVIASQIIPNKTMIISLTRTCYAERE